MTKPENIFLTDKRREVLQGTSDWEDASVANEKSRIKNRARLATAELIDVANSPHIENRKALPPEQVGELIESVVTPRTEPEGYDEYRRDLYFHVRRALDIIEELD
jgi:hypothetical protein